MTTEELLKPRYKVIADYPDNQYFVLNKIIEFEVWAKGYWKHEVTDCQGTRLWLSEFFDKYPHLFKRLEWWEERKESDMPEYVKVNTEISSLFIGEVYKIKNWGNPPGYYCKLVETKSDYYKYPADNFLPATKEEYELNAH